jgi:hypothetical protein
VIAGVAHAPRQVASIQIRVLPSTALAILEDARTA